MSNQIAQYDLRPNQLKLIRDTIAKDATPDEFDLFIQRARLYGLNPLKREIYLLIFNKDKPKYRQATIITGIDGYRIIAERTGNYRPDDEPPRYEYSESAKSDTNPLGIISASVAVYKFSHGEWHKTPAIAYWDEYAPVKDEWVDRRKTGRKILTGKWPEMPRLMIAKVAEALALRKAFPNDLGGMYVQEEMDRAEVIDGTATEILSEHEKEDRRKKAGVLSNAIPLQPPDGTFDMVPIGQFADRFVDLLNKCQTADDVARLVDVNSGEGRGLRSFWAENQNDALELKKIIETRQKALK